MTISLTFWPLYLGIALFILIYIIAMAHFFIFTRRRQMFYQGKYATSSAAEIAKRIRLFKTNALIDNQDLLRVSRKPRLFIILIFITFAYGFYWGNTALAHLNTGNFAKDLTGAVIFLLLSAYFVTRYSKSVKQYQAALENHLLNLPRDRNQPITYLRLPQSLQKFQDRGSRLIELALYVMIAVILIGSVAISLLA